MKFSRPLRLASLVFATLLAADDAAEDSGAAAAFAAAVRQSFPAWDADQDGALSDAEIDTALGDARFTGDAGAALATLKRLTRRAGGKEIPRTADELSALAESPKPNGGPKPAELFADAKKRIGAAGKELFAAGVPLLETLRQGEMGNCFSLAPLGSMLSRNPAQVRAMFRQNQDGTFAVKIGKQEVQVAAPTEAEVALSSSSEFSGVWSNVFEKAAGVARNQLRQEKDRAIEPLDALARGGSAGTMLAFITGHEMERFTLKWAKGTKPDPAEWAAKLAELRGKLAAAFVTRRCVTTGTLKPAMPGLRPNHAYGVVGYDAATDEVRLWDPHGDAFTPAGAPGREAGFPRRDGICAMPLPIFASQFAGLAFEIFDSSAGEE